MYFGGFLCYDRKKKVLVICLAGARSLLRLEKKDTVVCLAGAQSLLRPENTCFAWAGGTFFPVVLLCCVSFWFLREKGFDLHTHVLLRVQYSCGGVLVFRVVLLCQFLVLAGN